MDVSVGCARRVFASEGTLAALAYTAQILPRIDSGSVTVEPVELQCVAAYRMGAGGLGRRGVHGQNSCRLALRLSRLAAFLGALVVAGGAGAGIAQPGKGPGAAMPVLPVDLQALALGEQHTHLLRGEGDARQGAILFRLARRMFLVDKTYAFVAHTFSLQMTDYR
jgi:hypothetical protein